MLGEFIQEKIKDRNRPGVDVSVDATSQAHNPN